MGRVIRDFNGSGTARIARPTNSDVELPESQMEALGTAIKRVGALKSDRPIIPGYELAALSEAREADKIAISALKSQVYLGEIE